MRNHGIDLEREKAEQDGTEWRIGAASQPCLLAIPLDERMHWLPNGELQFGVEDFQDCVTRAYINILEAKFTRAYALDLLPAELKTWLNYWGYVNDGKVEFSDAFIAIKSGTTRTGNSFKAPADAIHNFGLIPKKMLPRVATMTWDQYNNPARITKAMEDLGKEFKVRFPMNYEQGTDIKNALKLDSLNLGVFAWPTPINGVYPRIDGPIVHAVMGIQPDTLAFDNYPDSFDGDWVKQLASDYHFYDYAYRIYVSGINIPSDTASEQKVAISLLAWILNWWRSRKSAAVPPVIAPQTPSQATPVPAPVPTVKSPAVSLYDAAYACIGQDLSQKAPDERGCAESVSRVIQHVIPSFPIFLSTIDLCAALEKHPRFKKTTGYSIGTVAVAPTHGTKIGHCWIMGKEWAMSNTSKTGLFMPNYTNEEVITDASKRDLSLHFFSLVE